MKETIIFAPGANNAELTRSLARFGKSTIGMRIASATELARFALMRSGTPLSENLLPAKQEPAMIDAFIREIPYFAAASFADSEKIAAALSSLRHLIKDNETETIKTKLVCGEFPEKNASLISVYERYLSALKNENMTDSIGLIRYAIKTAKPLSISLVTLKEFPLSPLEAHLADVLAPQRHEITLAELFEKPEKEIHIQSYKECYGNANEIEAVFEYITKENLPFDTCTVAVAGDESYLRLLYDTAVLYNIPISFGCGLPILYANPAILLKLLHQWNTRGYNGKDALSELIYSSAFDRKKFRAALGIKEPRDLRRFVDIVGNLRLGWDAGENIRRIDDYKATPFAESALFSALDTFAHLLSMGESKIIEKFSVIREGFSGRIDRSALSVICDALEAYRRFSGSIATEQMIPEILKKNICSENSQCGALFVTSIRGALSTVRKNLFVVGLSASNFPGAPKENYVMLDSDYLLLADEETAPTSKIRIAKNKEVLGDVLMLASALSVNTHLSYASYLVADLKIQNPSSVLFEIFKKQAGETATMQDFYDVLGHIGYFDQKISDVRHIGKAFTDGYDITFSAANLPAPPVSAEEIPLSPTAIDDFFNCPFHFYLTKILGIREQDTDDPFEVIAGSDIGTLVHTLMEEQAKSSATRDDFLKKAETAFDTFLMRRPPIHEDSAKNEKEAFLRIMENAYDLDPHNEVLASEEEVTVRHTSGILLHGIPDRVEKAKDGTYLIADYKSAKYISHMQDDIDTCLQVVIYAYIMEKKGTRVSRCEYRYLRDKKIISCVYDDAMKEKLNDKLTELKKALTDGVFEPADSEDACQFCKLKSLCSAILKQKEEAK